MTSSSSERGSVFLYILIGVALFVALTYAIANSIRSGSNITGERASMTAAEIIDTGNKLAEAVARIRLRDVTQKAVSFQNATNTNYTNPNCSIEDCKVFSSGGGGMTWQTPAPNVTTLSWFFSGNLAFQNIGADSKGDLVAFLPAISLDICNKINSILGISTTVPSIAGTYTADYFVGTYGTDTIVNTVLAGKSAGCMQPGSLTGTALGGATINNPYVFYQVLVAN